MVLLFTHFKYKRTNPCAKLSLGPFNYYVFAVRGRGKVGHSIITSALRGEEEGGGGGSVIFFCLWLEWTLFWVFQRIRTEIILLLSREAFF